MATSERLGLKNLFYLHVHRPATWCFHCGQTLNWLLTFCLPFIYNLAKCKIHFLNPWKEHLRQAGLTALPRQHWGPVCVQAVIDLRARKCVHVTPTLVKRCTGVWCIQGHLISVFCGEDPVNKVSQVKTLNVTRLSQCSMREVLWATTITHF